MTPRSCLLPVLFPLLLALAPVPARGHEYWLTPSQWRASPGDTVAIGARSGEGFHGKQVRLAPDRVVRLMLRAARELDLAPVARGGDTTWARFAPGDRGGVLFAYESDFASLTLDAARFERYLVEEGLDAPRAARLARRDTLPGRERYRRCAKLWLAGDDARRATVHGGHGRADHQ